MIRRYCSQHVPVSEYQIQIPTFVGVTDGPYLLFQEIEITDPNAAADADAFMASIGWVLASIDPPDPMPQIVVTSPNGSNWAIQVDNAGVLSAVAYP